MYTPRKIFVSVFLLLACMAPAQPGTWTWMKGASTTNNSLGTFGVQGVPAPTNEPPALYEAAFWTDLNGNFWVLGGYSANSLETALWKFDPATNLWTWMKGPSAYQSPGVYGTRGVPSPANYPGARAYSSATWTDNQNNLWLFGGKGYGSTNPGMLNDLWKYDIATNEWTWMSGSDTADSPGSYGTLQVPASTNQPPPRVAYSTWVDSNGDLWMYGGWTMSAAAYGHTFGDMWKYSIATGEWTWMQGSSGFDPLPGYGTKGVASPSNTPGGRASYSRWKDSDGSFWFFGGNDYSASFSDFWKFDPLTNEWTWMAGSSLPDDTTRLGPACEEGDRYPLPRNDNTFNWTDGCGRFWSYGGWSAIFSTNGSLWDDLSSFDPGTLRFRLVDGQQQNNVAGVYGTQLVPSPNNYPGSISGGCSFTDAQGNFWLFGGAKSSTSLQIKNTLWKYVPDTNCVKYISTVSPPATICAGSPAVFLAGAGHPGYSFYWEFGDNTTGTEQNPSHAYNTSGTYQVTLYYRSPLSTCLSPDRDTFTVTVSDPVGDHTFPNVFTPNGDGTDDVFPAFTDAQAHYHLSIYNRWGQLVFETADAQESWNGTINGGEAPDGIYFWSATLYDCEGRPIERNGFVHLIR